MTRRKLRALRANHRPPKTKRFNGWSWEEEPRGGATHVGRCRNRQGIPIFVRFHKYEEENPCRHCGRPYEAVTAL